MSIPSFTSLLRYQYHFGGDRRDSTEKETPPPRPYPAASRARARSGEEEEDIKGFRQWTRYMQEDLLILRDLIFEEHPDMDSSSKEFAQKLLGKHTTVKPITRMLLCRV